MPTTVVSLALLVAFLSPGFVWLTQRRRIVSQQSETTLSETAKLLVVSLIVNLVALALFAIVRASWPASTPDVGKVLMGDSRYERHHFAYLVAWGAGVLLVSWVIAARLGRQGKRSRHRVGQYWPEHTAFRWIFGGVTNPIEAKSTWEKMFEPPTGHKTVLRCKLVDGSIISGGLAYYSAQVDEDDNRAIALHPPFSWNGEPDEESTLTTDRIVLKAANVSRIDVKYLWAPKTSPGPARPPPAA